MNDLRLVKYADKIRHALGDDLNAPGHGCSQIGLGMFNGVTHAWYLTSHGKSQYAVTVHPCGLIERWALTADTFNAMLNGLTPVSTQ
jgi:hypothetical protein